MKKLLVVVLFFLSFICFSQKDWNENIIYKFKGNETINCDTTIYSIIVNNDYGNPVITGYYMKCKMLVWSQEYFTGNVSFWFHGKWRTEPGDGKFRRCQWADFINLLK